MNFNKIEFSTLNQIVQNSEGRKEFQYSTNHFEHRLTVIGSYGSNGDR